MVEQWAEGGSATEPGPGAAAGPGLGGVLLLSFERLTVAGHADSLREAGPAGAGHAEELVAALTEASTAAAGMAGTLPGGVLSGPVLAECAALLARRVRHFVDETDRIAEDMTRAAGQLVSVEEEVARRVAEAG